MTRDKFLCDLLRTVAVHYRDITDQDYNRFPTHPESRELDWETVPKFRASSFNLEDYSGVPVDLPREYARVKCWRHRFHLEDGDVEVDYVQILVKGTEVWLLMAVDADVIFVQRPWTMEHMRQPPGKHRFDVLYDI
jgi:hypothetical protein